MKKLIICEKPSLAEKVCSALRMNGESVSKKDGYSESTNYFVVPAFGHLFGLMDIEEYSGIDPSEKSVWSMGNLPFFPTQYQFALKKDSQTKKVDSGVKKQFLLIKKLIHDSQTQSIIHCGDSDREGEIIVRIILDEASNSKPVYRLWLPDQVETTIIKSLSTMESDSKYDALAEEGYARTFIDWVYGVNLTRYATLKSGALQRVGRVVSAIIKTIYDRDMEIKNFVPKKYFVAYSKEKTNGEEIELTAKQKYSPQGLTAVRELCDSYNYIGAKVTDLKTERKVVNSPKLFSQSGLQNALSKRFKYSPAQTLDLVQVLYEKGFVSYPRTPTEYMATAEKDRVKEILEAVQGAGNDVVFKDKKSIFDDSKIESHSAITPTTKIPTDSDFKSKDEKNCYEAIFNRFCAVFCKEDCVIDETIMIISIGDREQFTKKGVVPIQSGWKQFEPVQEKETVLPNLKLGDKVVINFKPLEKQTEPKIHHTVESLNNYLKNPFKKEKNAEEVIDGEDNSEIDDEDYKALLDGLEIGTEATRPAIISNAINSGYIVLEKTNYLITPSGIYYVELLDKLGIDMSKEKTVFLGKTLKDVYKGEKTIEESLAVVNAEITEIFAKKVDIQKVAGGGKQPIGKCPKCGKNMIAYQKAYACESGKEGCGFVVFREIAKKEITPSQVQKLLTKRKTDLIKGFTSSKTGKKFEAYLILNPDNTVGFQFKGK